MDLVEGLDLEGRARRSAAIPGCRVAEAIEFTLQACEALQYVHEQQIVHRDVKPQNLILEPEGVVLVDFGIARELDDEEDDSGTVGIGTPRYMAPEVFAGGAVSRAATSSAWRRRSGRCSPGSRRSTPTRPS